MQGPRRILLVQDADDLSRSGHAQGTVQMHAPASPPESIGPNSGMLCSPVKFSEVVSCTTSKTSSSRHRLAVSVATPSRNASAVTGGLA